MLSEEALGGDNVAGVAPVEGGETSGALVPPSGFLFFGQNL